MSDKANLTNAELELTQRIQMHFPRGVLSSEVLKKWNSCPTYIITRACKKAFAEFTENQQILEVLGTVNVPTTEDFVVRSYIRDMETRSNRIIDIFVIWIDKICDKTNACFFFDIVAVTTAFQILT